MHKYMYVFSATPKQMNTFRTLSILAHSETLDVGVRLPFSSLGHFIVFFVDSSFRLPVGLCVCVCVLVLATGLCACTHFCALTSVNQVKIDIFMLVNRCVGVIPYIYNRLEF